MFLWSTDGRSEDKTLAQESLRHSSKSLDTHKEDGEDAPVYTEESGRQAQRGAILLAGPPTGQVSNENIFKPFDDSLLK